MYSTPSTPASHPPHVVAVPPEETGDNVVPGGVDRPEGATAPRRWRLPNLRTVVVAAFAAGFSLRILQYLFNRALWLDEALMVPRFVDLSYSALMLPSSWSGVIPPGFLFTAKAAVSLFGNHELALRLIPLLSGLAALALFLVLAQRVLSPAGAALALVLFALAPYLVYYSSELKQYSSDVLVSIALLLLAFRLHDRGVDRRRALEWGAAGVVAVAFSLTAVFVLAGCTTVLGLERARSGDRAAAGRVLAVAGFWAVLFGVPSMLFFSDTAASNTDVQDFWSSGFMPLPPRSIAEWAWFPRTFARVFRDPLGVMGDQASRGSFYHAGAGIVCFVAGCAWTVRTNPTRFWLMASPIAATLLASALHKYPFGGSWTSGGRVILFLTPMFLLLIAEGAVQLLRAVRPNMTVLGVALIALLILPPLSWAALAMPYGRHEIKPLLGTLDRHWQPDDVLWVHYDTRHAFSYYSSRFGIDPARTIIGECARLEPQRYVESLVPLRGFGRVWVMFAAGKGAGGFDERKLVLDYLDHAGARLAERKEIGASLYLYDLRAETSQKTPFRTQIPRFDENRAESCAFWN